MKKMLVFFTLFLCLKLSAQQDSLPIGKVVYYQKVSTEGDIQNNGHSILLFNRKMSIYTQNGVPKADSSYNDGSHFSTTVSGDTEGFPILKLHRDSVLYFKEPCPRYSKSHCVIKDTFMTIVWTIHTDQKSVGTYSCNRATGHFRGRDYEVWFAPEIPVPTGPFKLGGLPGLILEAKSTDGAVVFQFEELVLSGNMTETMQKPSGKDINMTFSEFMEDQDKHHKMLIANAKAKGFDISISRLERIELNTH